MLVKKAILREDPKQKKKLPELAEEESDFEEETISATVQAMNDLDVERQRKKLEKENDKIKAGGGDAASVSSSSKPPAKKKKKSSKKDGDEEEDDDEEEREVASANGEIKSKEEIDKLVKQYIKKGTASQKLQSKIEAMSLDKLLKCYSTLVDKIRSQKTIMIDKEEGKTTALGTSKINYIDPRISVAWCLKFEVPIDKIFNGTLREKFRWAIESVDEDWVSRVEKNEGWGWI